MVLIIIELVSRKKKKKKKRDYSPPQQKPAAPIAEKPLDLRASTTNFASSNPLSCDNIYQASDK